MAAVVAGEGSKVYAELEAAQLADEAAAAAAAEALPPESPAAVLRLEKPPGVLVQFEQETGENIPGREDRVTKTSRRSAGPVAAAAAR